CLYGVHLNVIADVVTLAAQISEVVQRIIRPDQAADLDDEGVVVAPTVSGLKARATANPIGRVGRTGDVGVARGVRRDGGAGFVAAAAYIGGVDQTGGADLVRVDLGDESIGIGRVRPVTGIRTGLVEAGLVSVEEGEPWCGARSRQHVGCPGDVHVDGAGRGRIHGNAAANRGCGSGNCATEVGGVDHALETAAGGIDLAGEKLGVAGRVRHRLIGVGVRGEAGAGGVAGSGDAGDEGVLRAIDCQPGNRIGSIAGEIGGIGQAVNDAGSGARVAYLAEESVGAGLGARLERSKRAIGGEVRRSGRTGNVDTEGRIDRDSGQTVDSRTAKVGCVNELLSVHVLRRHQSWVDHRNEDVLRVVTAKVRLVRWIVRVKRV